MAGLRRKPGRSLPDWIPTRVSQLSPLLTVHANETSHRVVELTNTLEGDNYMPRKPALGNPDFARNAVAYMRAHGYSTHEIADTLQLSESLVWRLRKEAQDAGELINVEKLKKELEPAEEDEIQELIRGKDSKKELEELLERDAQRHINVAVYLPRHDDAETTLNKFGRWAARIIKPMLEDKNVRVVGTAFGRAVYDTMVEGLRQCCDAPRKDNPIQFFPIRGDALVPHGLTTSSSIAWHLDQIVNGGSGEAKQHWQSLVAVPPAIPGELAPKERYAFKKYLHELPGFSKCYPADVDPPGERPGLIDIADLLVTSLGPPVPESKYTEQMFTFAGFDLKRDFLAGDLAGIPILNEGAEKHRREVKDFEENRLLGAKSEDFRRVAESGRVVVLAARQVTRADCLREVCRQRLVSHVCIDRDIASALRDKLRRSSRQTTKKSRP